jgi:hypothetical protein
MYKTYTFDNNLNISNGFVVPVKDVPKGKDINTLKAYTDNTCSTSLPIDVADFINSGVVYVRISKEYITDGQASFYLDFNGNTSDISLNVWNKYEIIV